MTEEMLEVVEAVDEALAALRSALKGPVPAFYGEGSEWDAMATAYTALTLVRERLVP